MSTAVFADESCTHKGPPCYGIGAFSVPEAELDSFERRYATLRERHGVSGELKWKKIGRSHGEMNLVLDLVRYLFETPARFSCMVVHKGLYLKWGIASAREDAFYKSYTFLISDLVKLDSELVVTIDNRSDSYLHRTEVCRKIANYIAGATKRPGHVKSLVKGDSKHLSGLQVADVLTGAIVAGHLLHLEPETQMKPGKRLLLDRLARMLGWSALCHDTLPRLDFNVWHFPVEWRNDPSTEEIRPDFAVPYVRASELEGFGE